jgi:hypothetical protein
LLIKPRKSSKVSAVTFLITRALPSFMQPIELGLI